MSKLKSYWCVDYDGVTDTLVYKNGIFIYAVLQFDGKKIRTIECFEWLLC